MSPQDFIAKWRDAALTERQGAQSHFLDLCELLAVPKPHEPERRTVGHRGRWHAGPAGDGYRAAPGGVKSLFFQETRMVRRWMRVLGLGVVVALGAGCSGQQLYASGQAYQRNQCARLPDQTERETCLRDADRSYDAYQRETRPEGR